MKRYIAEGLEEYLKSEHHPWHMPGHKRKAAGMCHDEDDREPGIHNQKDTALKGRQEYKIVDDMLQHVMQCDVTEVPGLDDLHHPAGMIQKSQDALKDVYGTCGSFYLINGSTCGIMAAITACCHGADDGGCARDSRGEYDILVARNCHKAVYNTIEFLGLSPLYVTPQKLEEDIYGGICPEDIDILCRQHPGIRAVVITSPTYEGIVSDIAGIKRVLKRYDIPLIVDEAHGAHFYFMSDMPESAVTAGADIIIESLHKTLASMTQTAVLHVTNEKYLPSIRRYLSVYMSSSPSYQMLCSMEYAVALAQERDYENYFKYLKDFRDHVQKLRHMRLLGMEEAGQAGGFDYDRSRIVLIADTPVMGLDLEHQLAETGNIVCEMSGLHHIVLISTAEDSAEDFAHLYETLEQIDSNWETLNNKLCYPDSDEKIEYLRGNVATANIYVYPPGIPIVTAGETVTEEKISILYQYLHEGKQIYGL